MKKILYLMGIDWYWIKQRPQIIAEMLSKDYDLTVIYQKEIAKKIALRKDKDELRSSIALPVLPYRDKNDIVHAVQKLILKTKIKNIHEFDMIWLGHPLLYRYVPSSYQGKVIYDCMDNHTALCTDSRIKKTIRKSEEALLKRADFVFISSSHLKKRIETGYQYREMVLVRNGFIADVIHKPDASGINDKVKIGYFGTIAEWIDFSAIVKSLKEVEGLEYYFWGPVLTTQIPRHPGLRFEGVVEHKQLWNKAKDMNCLIMPFKVNDIIEDVDPVKLYEYISMGKTIVAPYYHEIERFAPYVYFYHSGEELVELLSRLRRGELQPKYSPVQQEEFLRENTWDERYEIIRKRLSEADREEHC